MHFAFQLRRSRPGKLGRSACWFPARLSVNAARDEALRAGLQQFGYEEGKNIAIVYKYAEGKTDRLPNLAKELIAEKPDVIVVGGTAVAVAAKNATSTIPIVVAGAGDLVEAGLIKSFMYPGGNVTGVARLSADFFGDRVKLHQGSVAEGVPGNGSFESQQPGTWPHFKRRRARARVHRD